ncbi:MAG: efflux RND transporter permease subunit [Planctomycetaceae bacterium]|nr:efflux RND transporter permease subunit [Planctomycetaceae bacterium]
MNLISFFVRSPIKVSVGVLLVSLFGTVALMRMPMQLTPEVQTPTITVETRWPGASPQEIEQEIIVEQEEQLKNVEGITKMSSESTDSKGTVTLEFLVGTKMEEAVVDVIGRLEQVPSYPEDADKPVISTANSADRPIAWFILSAKPPSDEELAEFQREHPEVRDGLARVRSAHNPGLAMMRLRDLSEEYPVLKVLLPPADLNVMHLKRFCEDEIEARFERVSGVAQSNVIGGQEDEMQVIVDPEKLAAREVTITDLRNVLRGQNEDTSAGDFWESKRRWVVRTLSQFESPEDVEDQLVVVRDGAPIYVRDVAEVKRGFKKPDGMVRRFGGSSIAINCQRQTGANVLDVMEGLRQVNKELNETVLAARGLSLTQVYDETDYIYSSVDLVQQNLFIGGALTMIVLMSFLHLGIRTIIFVPIIAATAVASMLISPWIFMVTLAVIIGAGFWFARGALVVGLAIPTSIIGTFLILQSLDRSLNVISLAGMAFAVGMLVDNAVVVLENIYSRYARGEDAITAATKGTQEVWGAIVASTLTTVAVFLPIVFIQEEAGQLFRDIALAISGAVALSLVVSMTVIPTAASRLFSRRTSAIRTDGDEHTGLSEQEREKLPGWQLFLHDILVAPIENLGRFFVKAVTAINAYVQRNVLLSMATVLFLVVCSIGLSWYFWPKVEYLPNGNRNLVFGILLPPPGYNLDQLKEMGETVEDGLRPYWDIDPESPEAQKLDYPPIGDLFFVARGRSVFMGVRAYDPLRAGELTGLVTKVASQLPGTFAIANQSSLFEQGLEGGRKIEVEITGPELTKLVGIGGQVFGGSRSAIPGAGARPVPSLDLSSPELHVIPKREQAAEMGLSATEIGYTVNALVDGAYAGDYFYQGDKIDLTIIGEKDLADQTQDIAALPVATPTGELVSLEAVATVKLGSGPEQINHRERERAITIEVTPPPDVPLESAMEIVETQVVDKIRDSGQLANGYRMRLTGTAEKLSDTWRALRFNIFLALLITYLLMAALFESWVYPMVIILSVPLGAVGGILGLRVLNMFVLQPLDILTMLGFVILIGTVVNNPILIVHQSLNLIRDEEMEPHLAIVESVRTRIRPIFMTTTTTVLGLLPLVIFPGSGSELYRGLGSVVLGGLLVSTIFTLFLVPTLFNLVMQTQMALGRLREKVMSSSGETATESDAVPDRPQGGSEPVPVT